MSRWIGLGMASLALALMVQVSDAEARGRRTGYCADCQFSIPTVTLPAAQAPAPPTEGVAEIATETPVASVELSQSAPTYTQNASTRRVRWFGRFRR